MPVYYILMATRLSSLRIASWTWPILAAANGYRLSSLKFFSHSGPYSLIKFLVTCLSGMISASDLAFSMASLMTGGSTDSSLVLNIYPILRAPPLIFLKLLASLSAFFWLMAYLATPDLPYWSLIESVMPTFYFRASAIVPPMSYIPSMPKWRALLAGFDGTYLS